MIDWFGNPIEVTLGGFFAAFGTIIQVAYDEMSPWYVIDPSVSTITLTPSLCENECWLDIGEDLFAEVSRLPSGEIIVSYSGNRQCGCGECYICQGKQVRR